MWREEPCVTTSQHSMSAGAAPSLRHLPTPCLPASACLQRNVAPPKAGCISHHRRREGPRLTLCLRVNPSHTCCWVLLAWGGASRLGEGLIIRIGSRTAAGRLAQVISVGLCLDYAIHVAQEFLIAEGTGNERAQQVRTLGRSVSGLTIRQAAPRPPPAAARCCGLPAAAAKRCGLQ